MPNPGFCRQVDNSILLLIQLEEMKSFNIIPRYEHSILCRREDIPLQMHKLVECHFRENELFK